MRRCSYILINNVHLITGGHGNTKCMAKQGENALELGMGNPPPSNTKLYIILTYALYIVEFMGEPNI